MGMGECSYICYVLIYFFLVSSCLSRHVWKSPRNKQRGMYSHATMLAHTSTHSTAYSSIRRRSTYSFGLRNEFIVNQETSENGGENERERLFYSSPKILTNSSPFTMSAQSSSLTTGSNSQSVAP